ncbi:hypothetical protein QBC41DRAFT_340410 [Cercophora samala]|uniref:Uncharacterized protein n=1 Tax=Cercophora samala TaxID=330535 RepID=A0AA39Z3H0_9PEZI|nr:hypothetical protein QBC41DRAFT_340410 [Cercophora samala]
MRSNIGFDGPVWQYSFPPTALSPKFFPLVTPCYLSGTFTSDYIGKSTFVFLSFGPEPVRKIGNLVHEQAILGQPDNSLQDNRFRAEQFHPVHLAFLWLSRPPAATDMRTDQDSSVSVGERWGDRAVHNQAMAPINQFTGGFQADDDLPAIRLNRSTGPNPPDQAYQGIIKSEAHYHRLFSEYMNEQNHPHGDRIKTDIPSTDQDKEKKKKLLYEVLTAHYAGEENFQTTGIRELHPDQIEFAAYGTLLSVIRMSRGEIGVLKAHKGLNYKVYDSFTERWEALIALLQGFKAARFELLTKPGMMERFAANPTSEKVAKGTFARNNLRRNAEGKVARKLQGNIIKKRKREDGGWDIVSHEDENIVLHSGPPPSA